MDGNRYVIDDSNSNQRFDKFLLKLFNNAPKSLIYKLLRKKRIKLNGVKAEGNEMLCSGDEVTFYLSPDTISSLRSAKEIKAESADLSIIYEDENIILINKPAGMIVHPDSKNKSGTLSDKLLLYLHNKNEYDPSNSLFTPAICNRLDRNTSGIVAAAKNLHASQALNKAFKDREIDKYYIAAVCGKVTKSGEIHAFLTKDEKSNIVRITDTYSEGSSEILTQYTPITTKDDLTLLKIKLITGKSHQIRASFSHIGHPLAGDRKYGGSCDLFSKKYSLKHQLLHCSEISFRQKNTILEYLYGKPFYAEPEGIVKKCFDFLRRI